MEHFLVSPVSSYISPATEPLTETPEGEIMHSFYHCTGSICCYQKEEGRKEFEKFA